MRRAWRLGQNAPLPHRRREPLTVSEASFVVQRLGNRSEQTMSIMAGVSRASIRRSLPLALRSAPAAEEPPSRRRPAQQQPVPELRQASLTVQAAARELGIATEALCKWLVRERWLRRGRRGLLIAGARQMTAGYVNQAVSQLEHATSVSLSYGPIRITPRGMASIRVQLSASRGGLS